MRLKTLIISAVAAILAMSSCASQYDKLLASHDVPEKYKMAFQLFEQGKYSKAAAMFESLSLATSGTPQDDTVQFYWALSNYRFKDYFTAESNFNQFITVFPQSPFTEQARYYYIDCLYRETYRYELDQTPSQKAIAIISQFIYENPESDYVPRCREMMDELQGRIEKKSYEAARLYYHMEDYLAAHYALKNVLKDNADNRYREDILYHIALSAYKYAANSVESKQKERYLTFVDDYYNFVSEFPESRYRKDMDHLYNRVNKIIK